MTETKTTKSHAGKLIDVAGHDRTLPHGTTAHYGRERYIIVAGNAYSLVTTSLGSPRQHKAANDYARGLTPSLACEVVSEIRVEARDLDGIRVRLVAFSGQMEIGYADTTDRNLIA